MPPPPFVWFSVSDWDDVWTRKQRFAERFAQRGHTVLHVEAPVHLLSCLRAPGWALRRVRRALGKPVEVAPRIHRLTLPPLVPGFMQHDTVNELDARLIELPAIRRGMRALGIERPIVWVYPPHAAPVVEALGGRFSVYDAVDDWTSFSGLLSPEVVRAQELRLLRAVDLFVTTTESLMALKGPHARRSLLVPNAADAEHFRRALGPATPLPEDLARIPAPRLGFLGGVQYWIDFELLEAVARAYPEASLVLIGPVGRLARLERLRELPNVHVLGRREYPELPGYLKGFDVCLSPFLLDSLGSHVSPLKVFEYLAAGRSVVSVDMPSVRPLGEVVRIARARGAFVAAVGEALAEQAAGTGGERQRAALEIASRNTWAARFETIVAALGDVLA